MVDQHNLESFLENRPDKQKSKVIVVIVVVVVVVVVVAVVCSSNSSSTESCLGNKHDLNVPLTDIILIDNNGDVIGSYVL